MKDFLAALAAANVKRCPDFHAGGLMDWSPAERGNELAGEVGELCNELKKLLRFDRKHEIVSAPTYAAQFEALNGERAPEWMYSPGRWIIYSTEGSTDGQPWPWPLTGHRLEPERDAIVQRIRNELGDVIVCASLITAMFNIDLEAATRDKFNATSDKIGSKVKL